MRRDVQEIFRSTPHEKQVMMFSATLSKEIRPVCKKFMQDVGIVKDTSSKKFLGHQKILNHQLKIRRKWEGGLKKLGTQIRRHKKKFFRQQDRRWLRKTEDEERRTSFVVVWGN